MPYQRALAHRLGFEHGSPDYKTTALSTELSRLFCWMISWGWFGWFRKDFSETSKLNTCVTVKGLDGESSTKCTSENIKISDKNGLILLYWFYWLCDCIVKEKIKIFWIVCHVVNIYWCVFLMFGILWIIGNCLNLAEITSSEKRWTLDILWEINLVVVCKTCMKVSS